MKPSRLLVCLVLFLFSAFAADSSWQYGRIVEVRKSVNSRTKAWVVNTPITDETTVYTLSVHVQNSVFAGSYELTPDEAAPPPEWTAKYPVRVQMQGETMFVRGPTAEVRLHIIQHKAAVRPMEPLTAEEKKMLAAMESPAPQESMIGFSKESTAETQAIKPAEPVNVPPPPPPNSGTITVRSTPYLSEVFVDGNSMGYTPAKISLPPGKHSFRVEKPGYRAWTKELTLTVGSELTLDADLEKK
jgi:PEGA domain-containing protein